MHGYLSVQAVVFGKADEVQRAFGARDKVSADVCVSAGGTYGGMTEKDLNDPEIFSGLHEVGSEGMAEGVESDGFGYSGSGHGFLEGVTHRSRGDWSILFLAGKEVGSLWMNVFPVLMQEVEKTTTERNVSVFGPFSVAYVYQHACAVDVSGTAEPTNLRDSHSSRVSRCDNRSVLDGLYGPKESKNLILA